MWNPRLTPFPAALLVVFLLVTVRPGASAEPDRLTVGSWNVELLHPAAGAHAPDDPAAVGVNSPAANGAEAARSAATLARAVASAGAEPCCCC